MSDDISLPQSFEGIVRLFPLPNVVLFPRVTLPLHIFEPRYRQLTADALAGDRLITMALLKPGYEDEYDQRPPIHSVACVGKIVADQRLEDGRFNILLRGLCRVTILNEPATDKLYRVARAEVLLENPGSQATAELQIELARHVTDWLTAMGLPTEHILKLLKSDLPRATLCDVLAFALPVNVDFKQSLLEELDVKRRMSRLLAYLADNEPAVPKPSGNHKFPPEFSSN